MSENATPLHCSRCTAHKGQDQKVLNVSSFANPPSLLQVDAACHKIFATATLLCREHVISPGAHVVISVARGSECNFKADIMLNFRT